MILCTAGCIVARILLSFHYVADIDDRGSGESTTMHSKAQSTRESISIDYLQVDHGHVQNRNHGFILPYLSSNSSARAIKEQHPPPIHTDWLLAHTAQPTRDSRSRSTQALFVSTAGPLPSNRVAMPFPGSSRSRGGESSSSGQRLGNLLSGSRRGTGVPGLDQTSTCSVPYAGVVRA